jgi:hypothetical protein
MPHVFDDSSAAKGAASVSRLVLHTSVHFLRFEDFFAVAKGNMYTLADRVRVFTLKGESVGQEGFYTRIGHGRHRSPLSRIEYMPARSGWVSPEFSKIAEASNDFYRAFALGYSLSVRRGAR